MPGGAPFLVGLRDRVVLDTSERRRSYVVSTEHGAYIRLSETAYHLLIWLDDGLSVDEISERLAEAGNPGATRSDVEASCERLLLRLNMLASSRPKSASAGFVCQVRLVPVRVVQAITRFLTPAFTIGGAGILAGVIIAATVKAATYHVGSAEVQSNLFPTIGLALLSLFVHEFGHATACAKYGAQPHEIGTGIYMIYPAFYSNVTDAWRLSRWQRVLVDLGGVYFQCLAAALFVGLYEITRWEPLKASLVLILGSLVFTLNPFFKFDGYWVISDALGVTNLRDQWKLLMSAVINRMRARKAEPLPWPRSITACVAVASLVGCGLWLKFVLGVAPVLWWGARAYMLDIGPFITHLMHDPARLAVARVGGFLGRTYLFACGVRAAWQLGSVGSNWWRRRRRQAHRSGGLNQGSTQAAIRHFAQRFRKWFVVPPLAAQSKRR